MNSKPIDLPSDLASAYLALLSEREMLQAERDTVVAECNIAVAHAANEQAMLSDSEALIVRPELAIEKLRRELRGQRSQRTARLIDQMELQLEELVMAATEDEVAAQVAAAKASSVRSFTRKRPVRKHWPENVERERRVIDPPTTCACCGGKRLSKLGEDVNETLEEIPRRFIVVETVREKFTCRDCEAISQPPAPFHVTPRGFIGPHLLATILFDKFGMHSPLNRQSNRFKSEGIELSTSTLADQVGFGAVALMPVFHLIEAHVFAAKRLHGNDTTIPIQAKDKCTTGRIWTYVCDDRPFGGKAAPAAIDYASSDRRGEHPQQHLASYSGILQSDCYNGFEPLSIAETKAVPITFAFCHAHARRKFFELADIQKSARDRNRKGKPISPIALEVVQRYDALFEIERQINGLSAEERMAVRQERSKPLFDDMHECLKRERVTLSKSSEVIGPRDYMLERWDGFARFLGDGRICLTNNAAERALRGIALGRRKWTFAGSQRGADRAAVMLTFITTCRLNDIDLKVWLADVLERIADHPASRLHEMLPWEWKRLREAEKAQDRIA
ncbi:IS66 family transposase [Rhizobium sp. VS19-DR104.2]|uniref:IS66 family transposase n=1 Tax=unclassified Rhizobium TaxID=2613769 RepID=UPI001C5ACA5E|nr:MULTISPECIES: IS66 family transposase [unclassified Rhizobium]MBZ5763270.1 IS66 family transposase [Rhizobium sp. VS19-DR96]MBZ5769375.1 IS66 family transposase [Rhizobium sp. VS19-DR129.2]MBZ5776919.1 IS66 family transposase [Rhizobium sp. VS19-DRK62.2]MBZ5787859.1 IS66 family transposase [Rhizobium sp. VS19-DR121]MBZ5805328.1 IS66 family transposase [Rhizobium sp. VS19-DR181]